MGRLASQSCLLIKRKWTNLELLPGSFWAHRCTDMILPCSQAVSASSHLSQTAWHDQCLSPLHDICSREAAQQSIAHCLSPCLLSQCDCVLCRAARVRTRLTAHVPRRCLIRKPMHAMDLLPHVETPSSSSSPLGRLADEGGAMFRFIEARKEAGRRPCSPPLPRSRHALVNLAMHSVGGCSER